MTHDLHDPFLIQITSQIVNHNLLFQVEKHRASLECLLPFADVLFVGKDFAMLQGAKDCIDAAKLISSKVKPGTVIICPWGDQGASYCVATSIELTTYTEWPTFICLF